MCVALRSWEAVAADLRGSINVARLDVTSQPTTAQRCTHTAHTAGRADRSPRDSLSPRPNALCRYRRSLIECSNVCPCVCCRGRWVASSAWRS